MRYSHSRVECHNNCPYQYKLRYVDHIKTIQAPEADDALICGLAIHKGAETNLNDALKLYTDSFPMITDKHVNEIMKIEYLVPKLHEILNNLNVYKREFTINTPRFIGIVDLITKNDDGSVDVFDYKYSNNYEHYAGSPQLHLYKYFLEQIGFKVRKLGFIFIPKISIRQKQEEDLYQFRKRLSNELQQSKIKVMPVGYNAEKVCSWLNDIIGITEDSEYKKNPTNLCSWCEYKEYCLKGEDFMLLPKNVRREKKIDKNPDLWIYADSYVGKSTFADKYDDLLFLNTDGNTDNTTSPVVPIKDEITVTGRITNKKFAWEVFKEVITELEKKDNDFKRVALDLIEDLYEDCRLYMYDKNGWEHESDGGYGKGWDMIRTEFLSTMKRLKALGYQIIYISKEAANEVTLKNGTKYTTYRPNVNEKVANVLAGTVDLTVRAYIDGDHRYIQLAKDENVFGGGRFNFTEKRCELNMEAFTKALVEAQELIGNVTDKVDEPRESRHSRKSEDTTPVEENKPVEEEKTTETPHKRRRAHTEESEEKNDETPVVEQTPTKEVAEEPKEEEPKEEEKPRRRRRSRTAE